MNRRLLAWPVPSQQTCERCSTQEAAATVAVAVFTVASVVPAAAAVAAAVAVVGGAAFASLSLVRYFLGVWRSVCSSIGTAPISVYKVCGLVPRASWPFR